MDEPKLAFEYDVLAGRWSWSTGLRALHGLSVDDVPTTEIMLDRMVEEHRDEMLARFQKHLATPGPYTCVYELRDPHGRLRRVRYVGYAEAYQGQVTRLFGFVLDLTDMLREYANEAVHGAMEHRAAIEQAKGALMLSFGIDDEAAFDLLRTYSSRSNLKLSVVAARITEGLSDPRYSSLDPGRNLLNILAAFGPAAAEPADAATG
ncbi:hypothetical protein ASC58_09505 [Phycicoccus sp. Root101]|nr:hypothetical protein ASC58_09505 [Phycicoccus sp. Root101]